MATTAEELAAVVAQLPPARAGARARLCACPGNPPVFPHTPLPPGALWAYSGTTARLTGGRRADEAGAGGH